jgi:hypothetical protein
VKEAGSEILAAISCKNNRFFSVCLGFGSVFSVWLDFDSVLFWFFVGFGSIFLVFWL